MKSKYNIFIDGSVGTTGLRIKSMLEQRPNISIIEIADENRKDLNTRIYHAKESDITILCLPDADSKEFALQAPSDIRIIDASTAHRVTSGWVYGMPELTEKQRSLIASSNRVAVPGCHATGFILMARPLIDAGIVGNEHIFSLHSITGYSGGGKSMIAEYENESRTSEFDAPRQYALTQSHKHLPEMKHYAQCQYEPLFVPHVADYLQGLEVVITLSKHHLMDGFTVSDTRAALEMRYANEPFVTVRGEDYNPESGYISANSYAGRNDVEIFINGNEERIVLTARYDNLGKGASGAAMQCMNIMLGLEESEGLL